MIGALLAAGLALGSEGGAELGGLEDRFERLPQDYASAVALGDAALQAGDADRALMAWERAVALSKGNFESRRGEVLALTLAGRHRAATEAGDALTADFPDRPEAWAVRAWAWRWQPWLPQRSAHVALRSYAEAMARGGAGDTGCGVGWCRWALGDHWGAHRAFSDTAAPCAADGLRATPQAVSGWGAAFGGGAVYADHPWRTAGSLAGLQVGGAWSTRVAADATVRRVGAQGTAIDPTAVPAPGELPATADVSAQQAEVWLRVHTRSRHVGGSGLVASVDSTGDEVGWARIFGGRAWAHLGPVTLALTGAAARHEDGDHGQAGVDLHLPLTPWLAVLGGGQGTHFAPTASDAAPVGGGMGWGAVRVAGPEGRLSAQLGARLGTEVRPVRIDLPAVWNLDEALRQSADVRVAWRIDDRFTLWSGAERIRLAPPSGSTAPPAPESTATTGHLGLRVDLGPRALEDR